jgi:hypothetical protein
MFFVYHALLSTQSSFLIVGFCCCLVPFDVSSDACCNFLWLSMLCLGAVKENWHTRFVTFFENFFPWFSTQHVFCVNALRAELRSTFFIFFLRVGFWYNAINFVKSQVMELMMLSTMCYFPKFLYGSQCVTSEMKSSTTSAPNRSIF